MTRKIRMRLLIAFLAIFGLLLPVLASFTLLGDDGRGTPWILDRRDNICGLNRPRQLSNPAQVEFPACMAETPEIKRMIRDGIRPESPQGIQLRNYAISRVKRSCELVQQELGHCSVWKKIRRRDGREIPDITAPVVIAIRASEDEESMAGR